MMLTFILFFSFVVNTGMLVNAKINLQNAADLAAYAGAAVQARQLTDISYLNYEMRRQYKKFLFRYYVVGNMAQQTHPRTGGSGVRQWKPQNNSPVTHGVPAVCVVFNSGDNYCQIAELPPIPIPAQGAGPPDAIMTALSNQLKEIEKLRKGGCVGIGQTNMMLLYFWLMNTDLDLEQITQELQTANDPAYSARLRALRTLASGLGLIPKEILLRKRIDTLNRYVNFAPQTGLDASKLNALQGGTDWAAKERPIQAFLSAYHTLGNNTFPSGDIVMDEILPVGAMGADLLKLDNILAEFDAFAVDMGIEVPGGRPACEPNAADTASNIDSTGGSCKHCLTPMTFRADTFAPVVGVAKDPAVMTYYAVRLTAKAKVLFSPFGDMTMKAYAAAQPFGSRIGPKASEAFFTATGAPGTSRCFINCKGEIPNLPVKAEEQPKPSMTTGWNQNDVIYTFFSRFGAQIGNANTPIPTTLGHPEMMRAYHIAMVANPWESGRYNIPNDLRKNGQSDPFVQNFNTQSVHAIWAPLFTESSNSGNANPAAEIIQAINQFATTGDPNSGKLFTPAAKAALVNGITNYVNSFLVNGSGEDGEGVNVFRFFDPFKTRPEGGNAAQDIQGLPSSIYMSDADLVKTSWNEVLDGEYRSLGRTGYSVKFVPLNLLRTGSGITTDGSSNFSNRLPTSDGVGTDIENMQH